MQDNRAKSQTSRPALPKIDDYMRQLCAAIADELHNWPDVTSRKMFGMLGFYRDLSHLPQPKIFACIPDKRALSSQHAIAFRLEKPKPAQAARMKSDPRIVTSPDPERAAKWFEFSLQSPTDIPAALHWLGEAYAAVKQK